MKLGLAGLMIMLMVGIAFAEDTAALATMKAMGDLRVGVDTVWVLVTAMLVFWMNAGFAMVESGLCRAKNTVNILAKNFIVFTASTISFWVIGWGLMFGDGTPWLGLQGLWFASGVDNFLCRSITAAFEDGDQFGVQTFHFVE